MGQKLDWPPVLYVGLELLILLLQPPKCWHYMPGSIQVFERYPMNNECTMGNCFLRSFPRGNLGHSLLYIKQVELIPTHVFPPLTIYHGNCSLVGPHYMDIL
jgi:hypothetical protein